MDENKIDHILALFESEEHLYQESLVRFSEQEPFLLSFILSDSLKILNEAEKVLLQYLAVVIYETILMEYSYSDPVDLELIQKADEGNWEFIESNGLKAFQDIADWAFEEYPQEDLLAFVEDALNEDEEYQISEIGRKVLFVALKTLIDVLDVHFASSK